MQRFLLDLLECPTCHDTLAWRIHARNGDHIETGEALCAACGGRYPVRDGIALLLVPGERHEDLWEEAASGLASFLAANPAVDAQLTRGPLEALAPADQLFRALVLEERGDAAGAEAAYVTARTGLYTSEYLACYAAEREWLVNALAGEERPVVDIASGRGDLAEALLPALRGPLVLTDVSPRVLRNTRRRLAASGNAARVSLLACDARRTPFRAGSLPILATNFGLGSVPETPRLLAELRRIAAGTLYAVTYFFPPDDAANRAALVDAGLDALAFRAATLEAFSAAGWQATLENTRRGHAEPTPRGVLIEDAVVDGLPVAPTELEWCVLVAR